MSILQRVAIDSELKATTSSAILYRLIKDENEEKRAEKKGKRGQKTEIPLNVYLASTPQTRVICTRAEIVTPYFEEYLRHGIAEIIVHDYFGRKIRTDVESASLQQPATVDFLNILRGGSNFDPGIGLQRIGLRTIRHYVSSQRKRQMDGTWNIIQGGYEKLFDEEIDEPRKITLFAGDIVATGTSLRSGLNRTFQAVRRKGHQLQAFYFFTIGNQKAEEVITEILNQPHYRTTLTEGFQAHIIYLEGRFGLATSSTPLALKTIDTDLLTYHENAILTPEYAAHLFQKPEYVLEPCVIYDGGKRANTWPAHLQEVHEYWEKLQHRAEKGEGLNLETAVLERFPGLQYQSAVEWQETFPAWNRLDRPQIEAVVESARSLMEVARSSSLMALCTTRITECERLWRGM